MPIRKRNFPKPFEGASPAGQTIADLSNEELAQFVEQRADAIVKNNPSMFKPNFKYLDTAPLGTDLVMKALGMYYEIAKRLRGLDGNQAGGVTEQGADRVEAGKPHIDGDSSPPWR